MVWEDDARLVNALTDNLIVCVDVNAPTDKMVAVVGAPPKPDPVTLIYLPMSALENVLVENTKSADPTKVVTVRVMTVGAPSQ